MENPGINVSEKSQIVRYVTLLPGDFKVATGGVLFVLTPQLHDPASLEVCSASMFMPSVGGGEMISFSVMSSAALALELVMCSAIHMGLIL